MVMPGSSIPTVVALTARSARSVASAKPRPPRSTTSSAPLPAPRIRVASASACSTVRLPTVTVRAPARRQVNTTACAAPPPPATTTSRPSIERSSTASTAAWNPGASLLKPTSRPSSLRTMLLTAPIACASGSTSSTNSATTCLYGAVTPRPSQSRPRAAAIAPSTSSGSSSRRMYSASIPAAANAALCMTTEWRRRSGLPRRATRRVTTPRRPGSGSGDGRAPPRPGTSRSG